MMELVNNINDGLIGLRNAINRKEIPEKAGDTSENLLKEIRQIIYSLCREKEITKKVYNSIMNSIKL